MRGTYTGKGQKQLKEVLETLLEGIDLEDDELLWSIQLYRKIPEYR